MSSHPNYAKAYTSQHSFTPERDHLQSLKRDVYAASKSICLAQDSAAQAGLECDTLEKEISTLVHEIQNLKEELEETRRKNEEEGRVGRECRGRMERHRTRAEEVEQACPVQQELEGLRAAIERLKDRSKKHRKVITLYTSYQFVLPHT